jgi:ribulose bisphosphate carboxylase small subunit
MPYTLVELTKFVRERYMRVAAIDNVITADIMNICVAREDKNQCTLLIIAKEEVLH